MKISKNPEVSGLEELIRQRLTVLNPRESEIPVLKDVKSFIDKCLHEEKRPLYVFTDYDVDGVTSAACAVKLFKEVYPDADLTWRTPKRMSEGYGINVKAIEEVPTEALLITIDNGIVAFDAIKAAKEKGCRVIIIDHHLGAEDGRLPDADLIVDPNAIPEQSDFSGYCGCGLTYKLSQQYEISESLAKELRGLAALATIGDCVPLVQENWLIARDLIESLANPSIAELADKYQLVGINEGDAGFKVCPTLNAPGRLLDDGAKKAVEMLLGDSSSLVDELIALNEERKALTETFMAQAVERIEAEGLKEDNAISLIMDVPEGLVGIVAGRVAERYQCPAFIFARTEHTGVIKGSARTYGDNHLKKILDKCSDILLKYGGHAAAAGLSLKEENFEEFKKRTNFFSEKKNDDTLLYDVDLKPFNVAHSIIESLNMMEEIRPFGQDNPEPLFFIPNVRLFPRYGSVYKTMGSENQHLKLFGKDFDIVCFGMADEYLENPYEKVNVVGKVGVNRFNGKESFQIEAVYIEEAKTTIRKTNLQKALDKRATER